MTCYRLTMTRYTFKKYQPLSLRIWHWFNAVVIFSLLGTVLLRKTFLSWRTNSEIIKTKLAESGISVTPDIARDIAVSIRNPMWDWHYTLGFCLSGLVVLRLLVWLFAQKKGKQTAPKIWTFLKAPQNERFHAFHFGAVKTAYALFYLSALFMVASGLLMYFGKDLGLSKDTADILKEIHETMMWFFVVFSAGHIIGVLIAENREDKGIVSDMIHGGEKN